MIRKHCERQDCLDSLCCPRNTPNKDHQHMAMTPLNLNFARTQRISLKRFKSRQLEQARFRSPPSQEITRPPSYQTLPPPPKSALPNIAFTWSNPVIEPKREEPLQRVYAEDQAKQTQIKKMQMKELRRRFMAYRNSIVSIKSGSTLKNPRFEQSLILVDYFHPNSHQLSQMEPVSRQPVPT